ncbi:SDR family NAD(P)-dependent oxidoreductase [Cesiribacter andamanensis]|uniref:3-oxoacyl-[acyl-carrier-protein] reductase FabG n=1 Tax=Cesiribacter andamanensis AMV16 TaxID=1279009 RepID=M7N6J5_9BACT|nr:SDR family oxidoreductase [Cesiribacter andamanensis]EMR02902.1 3-oxoacyl-[acyl-carrier-protein] reductase FabG [Cesiribacter andamanensis AMV16]
MQIDLTNTNILVTGASRGIGRAIAQALAKSGARVAVHYNSNREEAEALARQIGGGSQAFGADLGTGQGPLELWKAVEESFGSVEVLVNNAGVAISSDIHKDDTEWLHDWGHTMMVNLNASALLCKKAIAHFQQRGGGRIITISSRAAFRGDTADYMAYAASKGGLVALSRSIARAFGKQGIKAFTVAPGFTRTDMAQDFMDQYGEAYALNDIALSQLTEPADIAPTIVFLASGLADHATGCTIDINAGSYVH